MAVAYTMATPLCTWLVAACMSVGCSRREKCSSSSLCSSNNRWARKRRATAVGTQCNALISASKGSISSYRSSIHGLMTSCLAFEPCDEYYNNKGLPLSLSLFGDCGLSSFFESKSGHLTRKQRRFNRALHSGRAMAVAVEPSMEVTTKKPTTKERQVVVTGMGVVTPLGHDPDIFYNNLLEGASGISEIETFDCTTFPTRIAGEIKSFSTEGWVAPKLSKRMDKFMLYLLTAGKKALADGGVTEDVMKELNKLKCGVLIGSAMGGVKVFNDAIEALRVSYRKMNPFCVPFATTNMGSAMLAMDLYPYLYIETGLGGFVACRALSQRNSDPTKASRPWDSSRDGFVMGEGAGVLLLEELEHALQRGANIYAEFLGGSFSCDAYHMTEPHPEGVGVTLCVQKALAEAGIAKEDINYINAHATSTPAGDLKEYQALVRCFGDNPELRINSSKSMVGHLLGAAGAVEAVATIQAIRTGWIHPNINLENPDEGVDANLLVGPKKERLQVKAALSNSFGFGGQNSSIIFAPYK
ncbi:hypothetical protein Cgig2_006831 [Carnegiea gigantea]|uniref:beta-ketoacyl-[acyl-carrier-protein] synthase I n=1 Tax=Carnegiea gigantea TaxID=171969 RepID=A0A9Q1GX82_9CARY|nr:hypothetical protein Cgig2_006831 [Carnegiea gigantea]